MPTARLRRLAVPALTVVLALGLAAAFVRAAQSTEFNEKWAELQREWAAEQQKLGLAGNRPALFARYPTPEIGLVKAVPIRPGTSGKISMSGKFADGTTFLAEHPGAQLAGGAVTGGGYAATLTIAPEQLPGFVRVYAFSPVSGAYNAAPVAFVDAVPTLELRSPNGWTIRAVPAGKVFTMSGNDASLSYQVDFFRQGEARPFESLTSDLRLSANDGPRGSLFLSLRSDGAGSAQAELEAIAKQMSNIEAFMKMSEAEQNALMKRMEVASQRMADEVMASVKDPAAAQKRQDDFGCQSLDVRPAAAGQVTGVVGCGRNVGTLDVTGTMTLAR